LRFFFYENEKEFVPCGRNNVAEHCGPLTKKPNDTLNEFLLLDRLRNVNLSVDEQFNEHWIFREVYKHKSELDANLLFLESPVANAEEELYFSGYTAVWSRGRDKTSSEVCYTTDSPIQFAFFCTKSFLNPDYNSENNNNNNDDDDDDANGHNDGIAFIDSDCLKVYKKNGENIISAIEHPISKVWITKHCVLIEKEASLAIIDGHHVPMPRFFSLAHALDDMFPLLIKSQMSINFITEDEYHVS
jgi:anaphase-promoting complex subunit 1